MPRRTAPAQCAGARMGGRRRTPDRATEPLFAAETPADAPLAARMRPQMLDEFVGQPHLVGDEGALTRVVRPGYLPSMVLWGPPGSGKTTLARLLAERSGGTWRQISAVTSGVADIRQLVADARQLRDAGGKTVVFIDELHRFNKAQQDALLPHVEEGTITLVGATTENPYYEINSPLLSRLRVYRLEPLSEENLREIVSRALQDQRGGGGSHLHRPEDRDCRVRGRRQRGPARTPGRGGGDAGGGNDRSARGAVRPRSSGCLRGVGAQVEPRRRGVFLSLGRRGGEGTTARPAAPASRCPPTAHSRVWIWEGLPLSARLRRSRCRPAIPARSAHRQG